MKTSAYSMSSPLQTCNWFTARATCSRLVIGHQHRFNPHIEEARRLGLDVLPPCVNHSERQFSLSDGGIRVGLEQVKGLTRSGIDAILDARSRRPFESIPGPLQCDCS